MLETIPYTTEADWLAARTRDVTSTESAALFGLSPYVTAYELWHRKRDRVAIVIEPNERMEWGTIFQTPIAQKIASNNGWAIRRMDEYLRDPERRMGASFDFSIAQADAEHGTMSEHGLLEIKTVDRSVFTREWLENDGFFEAPAHIEIQVQHQLAISGRAYCMLGVLVGGNTLHLIRREPQADIIESIRCAVAAFWRSVDANQPPAPDFKRDAAFIAGLYRYAEPGKVVDATTNERLAVLVRQYQQASQDAKALETQKDALRAQLLVEIGDAEKVLGDQWTISAGLVGPKRIEAFTRAGYRNLRVYAKEDK